MSEPVKLITLQKLEKYLDDNNLSFLKDSIKTVYINECSKSNSISTIRFFRTEFFEYPSVLKNIQFALGVKQLNFEESDINQIVIFDNRINVNRYFKYPEYVVDNPSLIHTMMTVNYGLVNYVEKIFLNNQSNIERISEIQNLDLIIKNFLKKEIDGI